MQPSAFDVVTGPMGPKVRCCVRTEGESGPEVNRNPRCLGKENAQHQGLARWQGLEITSVGRRPRRLREVVR